LLPLLLLLLLSLLFFPVSLLSVVVFGVTWQNYSVPGGAFYPPP
jgi:hypothetical protein